MRLFIVPSDAGVRKIRKARASEQTSFLDKVSDDFATWTPTKADATARLDSFLPRAGSAYAKQRNYDFGPGNRSNISLLSPWIRHRLLLEEDVVQQTLARHKFSASEKFVQEVFWRGYFKGWLEHRPEVWRRYRQNLVAWISKLDSDASLSRRYDEAVRGQTGIACFDAWAEELIATGYLHNHARMWCASTWIFTLKLPWEFGADFFYRHLLDGDAASNTCSWRWVGGLHTAGKTYLARPDNIARYTEDRFHPSQQLAREAPALSEPELPAPQAPIFDNLDLPGERYGVLITEEDCSPETLDLAMGPKTILALSDPAQRSVKPLGALARAFTKGAVEDAAQRALAYFDADLEVSAEPDWQLVISDWAAKHELDAIVTARLPIGPTERRLVKATNDLSIPFIRITRPYDRAVWPNAKRGFFGLKKKIPQILDELGLV